MLSVSLLAAFVMFANRPDNVMVKPEERPILVDVTEVVKEDIRISVQAQGTVTPYRETTIVAEVSGKIIEVSSAFHAGGYVAKGELLLRIDDIDYLANRNRAEAAVASAESNLAQEQGRAEVAAQEFKKFPGKPRSQTATDLYLRKPQLKHTQAQLLSAQADLRKAEHDLQRTVIRAPYDSIIREKRSDLGLYLTPGTPLASLFAIDFAEVRLAIPQGKLAYLDLPDISAYKESEAPAVQLYTNIVGELQSWSASLHRTEGVYDERSRVLFAVARISDPYALLSTGIEPLRIGTFVKAEIAGTLIKDLVVLPRYVLRAGGYVWVVDEQNTLRNRKVSTLRTQGDMIYVNGGLQQGEKVCLTVVGSVVTGSPVRISSVSSTSQEPEAVLETANETTVNNDENPSITPAATTDTLSTQSQHEDLTVTPVLPLSGQNSTITAQAVKVL